MSNVEIIRRYFEKLSSSRVDHADVREWLTDDFHFQDPLAVARSADEYIDQLNAVDDELRLRAEIREIVGEGDIVAALVDLAGQSGPIRCQQWFTFRDGLISSLEVSYDPRPFLQVPGPANNNSEVSHPPAGYPTICSYLNYEDTAAMIDWLSDAFAMSVREVQRQADGTVSHAEMALGDGVVMMGSPGGSFRNPRHLGQSTASLYICVDEIDQHCERARAAGADIIEEPMDQPYGHRRYGASDPEGHRWYFASPINDTSL